MSTSPRCALFETGTPEFHDAHIDYSGALFSPRPAAPLRRATGAGEAEDGLRGDAAAVTEQVGRYASAGIDELVIELAATDLDDFLGQVAQFAGQVAHFTRPGEK
jgi:hypothetical protein